MIPQQIKRVTISTHQQLTSWLNDPRNASYEAVMLVTNANGDSSKHISTEQVQSALTDTPWTAGMRYTLNGNKVGHVIKQG